MRNGMIEDHGSKFWYKNDLLHREDGPAIIYSVGDMRWYKEGKRHREDGPAIEYPDGSTAWYKEDRRHRLDGPAVEWKDGDKEWWLNGELVYEDEYDCTHKFELSDKMKRSIVKYKLERM